MIEAMKHKCTYPDCSYPCPDLPDCVDAEKQDADELLNIAYMSGLYDGKKAKKREWVGLTDEERADCLKGTDWQYDPESYAVVIEAKLKEKNT